MTILLAENDISQPHAGHLYPVAAGTLVCIVEVSHTKALGLAVCPQSRHTVTPELSDMCPHISTRRPPQAGHMSMTDHRLSGVQRYGSRFGPTLHAFGRDDIDDGECGHDEHEPRSDRGFTG